MTDKDYTIIMRVILSSVLAYVVLGVAPALISAASSAAVLAGFTLAIAAVVGISFTAIGYADSVFALLRNEFRNFWNH